MNIISSYEGKIRWSIFFCNINLFDLWQLYKKRLGSSWLSFLALLFTVLSWFFIHLTSWVIQIKVTASRRLDLRLCSTATLWHNKITLVSAIQILNLFKNHLLIIFLSLLGLKFGLAFHYDLEEMLHLFLLETNLLNIFLACHYTLEEIFRLFFLHANFLNILLSDRFINLAWNLF